MRVAALFDIHGNLPALEAVLDGVRQAGVDRIVVGGDLVPGPMIDETIACLLQIDIPVSCIQGNSEVAVLAEIAGSDLAPMPEQARAIVRWTAQHLQPEHQRLLASWPKKVRLDIDGLGDVLFCHGTPRHENEIFTRLTPEERLLPLFEGLGVSAVICGHTHMQFDRIVGETRVVNAGSVGMPFGSPGAYWLLLGPGVQLQHTPYDLAEAAVRIRASPYPQAHDFATNNVLNPPSEERMLELFARAELRYE
jgi:predicted phosphodiesterase